jgi:hypothetical protein
VKLKRGLVSTGIAAVGCRHEYWMPQSAVNLQKGERLVISHTDLAGPR